MEQSIHASFLKSIAPALRAFAGQAGTQGGILPKMRNMTEEVMQNILGKSQKTADA